MTGQVVAIEKGPRHHPSEAHWHDLPFCPASDVGAGASCYDSMAQLAARPFLTKEALLQDSESIRNAVLRYDITHPVVNDGNMAMWRSMGAASWPTFAVLSPQVSSSDVKCCKAIALTSLWAHAYDRASWHGQCRDLLNPS